MDQAIELKSDTTAAFVGRALRGPLDTPVPISSVNAFARRFGGSWQHSTLGPAVEQFFAHGGRRLHVVRVANNARGAMICLPAGNGVLVLRAREPGSSEQIRAAVDYDGIDAGDSDHFNLVVQRVSPETRLVVDQEIYRRVSCRAESRTFLGDALQASALVALQLPLPAGRPAATMGRGVDARTPYVEHAQRGTDGAQLSDYDLIGSATAGTGLFALDQVERLDLLYLPPPARERDAGPAALLAAELYCRRRGAMLIMDPPSCWQSAADAVAGMREAAYASPNMLAYFPRLAVRGDADTMPRPAGGAIAGLLCKADADAGPWCDPEARPLRREFTPAAALTPAQVALLNRAGLNALAADGARPAGLRGGVTLGRGTAADRHLALLEPRRLCLAITNTIERATRWAVFEADGARIAVRLKAQVSEYMAALAAAGAFAEPAFSVQCDAGAPLPPAHPRRSITVLLTFQPPRCDTPLTLTLHQTVAGCRVATTAFAPARAATAACA